MNIEKQVAHRRGNPTEMLYDRKMQGRKMKLIF
jgi:hypothetical protein